MEIICHEDLTEGMSLKEVSMRKILTVNADQFTIENLRSVIAECARTRAIRDISLRKHKWNGRIASYGNQDGGWRPVLVADDWTRAKLRSRERDEVLRLVYYMVNTDRAKVLPSKEVKNMMKPNSKIDVPHLTHGKVDEKLNMLYLVRPKKSKEKEKNTKISNKQLSMASQLEQKLIRTRW